MCASVVRRHDFDVLMKLSPSKLVFDAEVGEVNVFVEVRQVVLSRPFFDLGWISIRPAVALGPASVPLLKEALVLALEFLLEYDALDAGALLAEPVLGVHVSRVQPSVVGQFARPVDTRMECLLPSVVAVPPVRLEQAAASFRQRHRLVAPVERHDSDQSLIAKPIKVVA
jgi:hypothetical protein